MHQTGLILDDCLCRHDTGPGHPERADRIRAIRTGLASRGLADRCVHLPVHEAAMEHVCRVHTPQYVERLRATCRGGARHIDVPDSVICPESYETAMEAAGSVIEAVERVMAGQIRNAFCAVRPPGHHALADESMGFCLLNNVAIAAEHLVREHHLERVLILDWDVHHANGTQAAFWNRADVMLISLHGHPSWVYPGTSGWATETGEGEGEGFTLNLPMDPGSGDEEYRRAFVECILPTVRRYQPQFVLISAGFDAHRDDPLAPIDLEDASFDRMTRVVLDIAARYAGGRLVSVLEGGYNLGVLARCVASHVEHLLDYVPEGKDPTQRHGPW